MKHIFFFLAISIKQPVVWLTGAVMIATSFFSFFAKDMNQNLPNVVCSEDSSEVAREVMDYLSNYNFVHCNTAKEAENMIKSGEANTGLILHADFLDSMISDNMGKIATLLVSDRSLNKTLNQMYATFAIYQSYVPYFAANEATDMGYPADADDITHFADKIDVNRLEFQLNSVDGQILKEEENYDLQLGVLAVGMFAVLGFLCTGLIRRTCRAVRVRFQSRYEFFFRCLLPQCISAGILLLTATALGLLFASVFFTVPFARFLTALMLYQIILVVLFAVIDLLPFSDYLLTCLIAVNAVISLVLCPLYDGTNLLSVYMLPLRTLSVPYLLYVMWGLLF